MRIENIKLFLEVAKHKSIRKAAEQQYTSSQNLSTIIHNMEKEMKLTLFHKNNKGVELTDAGERFYPIAQQIVSSYIGFLKEEEIKEQIKIIDFYTTPAFVEKLSFLQKALLKKDYYVSMQKKDNEELCSLLEKDTSGIFFIPFYGQMQKLMEERIDKIVIKKDKFLLTICHSGHPLLSKDIVSEKDMENYIYLTDVNDLNKLRKNLNSHYDLMQISVDNTEVCKELMREKDMLNMIPTSLFKMNYANELDQWRVISSTPNIIEYALFFRLPSVMFPDEIKDEIINSLKLIFE